METYKGFRIWTELTQTGWTWSIISPAGEVRKESVDTFSSELDAINDVKLTIDESLRNREHQN